VVVEGEERFRGRRWELDEALRDFGAGGARIPRGLQLSWAPVGTERRVHPSLTRAPRAGPPRRARPSVGEVGPGADPRTEEPSVRGLVESAVGHTEGGEPVVLIAPESMEVLAEAAENAAKALEAVADRWMAEVMKEQGAAAREATEGAHDAWGGGDASQGAQGQDAS